MARFDRLTVLNTLLEDGLLPIFHDSDLAICKQVAGAVAEGGSRILEMTNRSDFAIDVFSELIQWCAQNYPDLIVGVGSIEDAPTAALFIAKGANLIVAPNFNEDVARLCNRRKIPYIPGCGSVSEITTAEEWGVEIVKLFPAASVGGPGFIKDLLGPRPWSRVLPTGGINLDEASLRAWFEAGAACVGMGGQLIRKDWLKAGNFDAIRDQTRDALALIHKIRVGE